MGLMKPLLLGLLGGMAGAGFACMTGMVHADANHVHESQDIKMTPRPMFEVVDDYKGCDVIRYTDHEGCVHFFIHCGEEVRTY